MRKPEAYPLTIKKHVELFFDGTRINEEDLSRLLESKAISENEAHALEYTDHTIVAWIYLVYHVHVSPRTINYWRQKHNENKNTTIS